MTTKTNFFVNQKTDQFFVIANEKESIGYPVNAKLKSLAPAFFRLQFFDAADLRALNAEEATLVEKLKSLPSLPITSEADAGHVFFNVEKESFFVLNSNSYVAINEDNKTIVLGWNVDKFGDPVEAFEVPTAKSDIRPITKQELLNIITANAYQLALSGNSFNDTHIAETFSFSA